jgi:hypothetical protein
MNAATEYTAVVELPNNAGFLYPLTQPFTQKFSTTPLTLTLGELQNIGDSAADTSQISETSFSPSQGIILRLSAPVSKAELMKHLFVSNEFTGSSKDANSSSKSSVPTPVASVSQ